MYFVLKSLKFYLHYSALRVSDTIVSIIRSFSAAHAVSGPVWCLVRCILQLQHSRTGGHNELSTTPHSALHVSDTIVSIIRSFSASHAVSGPQKLLPHDNFTRKLLHFKSLLLDTK